jgi:outer membrane lipoprotein SlyB
MRKIFLLLAIAAYLAASTGCATTNYTNKNLSRSEQRKVEKENSYNFMKGIFSFGGFAVGGLVGILTASSDQKLPSMLKGCVIGALAGFAAGYVVTENLKNMDDPQHQPPDNSRIDEYFRDYKNINGKD